MREEVTQSCRTLASLPNPKLLTTPLLSFFANDGDEDVGVGIS